jgi:hypothetical protein
LIRERRDIKAAPTQDIKSCGWPRAQHMQTGVCKDSQHATLEARTSHHKRYLSRTIARARGDVLTAARCCAQRSAASLTASVCICKFFHHSCTLRATALFHLGPHPTSTRPQSHPSYMHLQFFRYIISIFRNISPSTIPRRH